MVDDEQLYVNTGGMRTGALGFTAKGEEITSITRLIEPLLDPSALLSAVGDDPHGKEFVARLTESGQQLTDGVKGWGTAVRLTGDQVKNLARMYEQVESGATDAGRYLGQVLETGVTQINDGLGSGGTVTPPSVGGGGQGPEISGGGHHHG